MYPTSSNGQTSGLLLHPLTQQQAPGMPTAQAPPNAQQPAPHGQPVAQQVAPMQQQPMVGAPAAPPVQQPIPAQGHQTPVLQAAPAPAPQAPVAPAPAPVQQTPAPAAQQGATIPEIEQACPGAPADFVLSQVKAGATVQMAQTAYAALQNQRISQLETQVQQAAAPAPQAPAPQQMPGQQFVQPVAVQQVPQQQPQFQAGLPTPPSVIPGNQVPPLAPPQQMASPYAGTAEHQWNQAIQQEEAIFTQAGLNAQEARKRAVFSVVEKYPGLKEQYQLEAQLRPNRVA